ncbi:MAG: DUF1206 domain-containing protein [Parvularcula sp.]|jgi:hypothetical protein|nr:DUF1206 domain-containing protein [Parvularcula sp.]
MSEKKELFEKLARAGFAARGVVYTIIGVFAISAAFGSGRTEGSKGAIESLTGSTWGQVVLGFLVIGLFGYGLWRLLSGALDFENEGSDKKGIAKRVAYVASGLAHFALSIYAAALLFGSGGGGSGGGAQSMTAKLMQQPFGRYLVMAAGMIAFIVAAAQLSKAFKEKYRRHIALPDAHGVSNKLIKFGIISRAVVFAIIGAFLVYAGITVSPENAKGVGGALSWMQEQSYGSILLAFIGVGLLGFALFSFLQARYRVIPDPEQEARSKVAAFAR